jgi:hypothetical protein
MDLESVNRANFFKRCYPQLVLPVSCIANLSDAYSTDGLSAAELIVGMNYPILISKDDPTPAYLMPSASDMAALRSEIQQLKSNMFESVGLMLQSESRQVASAESKAWDFLDVAQVMKARAEILESAEMKVAEIVNAWDSSIPAWTVAYNRQFDIGDFSQEISALIMTVNASMPVMLAIPEFATLMVPEYAAASAHSISPLLLVLIAALANNAFLKFTSGMVTIHGIGQTVL